MLEEYHDKWQYRMMKLKKEGGENEKWVLPSKGHESLFILDVIIYKLSNFTPLNNSTKTDLDEHCI